MDVPTTGPPITSKLYPITLKYQKLTDEEIWLLESSGSISKSLSPWATQVVIIPKKPDPLNPEKQQLHLVLDYSLLNKSLNAAHNGNNVISYYPLPNFTHLLARLKNCKKIFSSLHQRLGCHHIGLMPKTKKKAFATTSGKWHTSTIPNLFSTRCILLPNVTIIIRLRLLFHIPWWHINTKHFRGRTLTTFGDCFWPSQIIEFEKQTQQMPVRQMTCTLSLTFNLRTRHPTTTR